jgi:hypothetical protein
MGLLDQIYETPLVADFENLNMAGLEKPTHHVDCLRQYIMLVLDE